MEGGPLIYAFGPFRLDAGQFRLTRENEAVHVEPLVFDLLRLFAANPGVVLDRDRMIAEVWGGRIVSDATLSTAVKSARRALGDSGDAQSYIETVRGRGFRFAPAVTALAEAAVATGPGEGPAIAPGPVRGAPSIAVLPFARVGAAERLAGLEEALPHEVILALARLRWLFVIARGSCFRFRGPHVDVPAVGRALGARYALTGTIEVGDREVAVTAELAETPTGRVVWGDRFSGSLDAIHEVRRAIVGGMVAALEVQIPLNEALHAQTGAPEHLDAWQAFHLGLKQMHEYTAAGNVAAHALFRRAVALEPGFARAHAGLSFVHFQNAFLRYVPDRAAEVAAARASAERGLALDPLDPFANFCMGRSFWLAQDLESALPWLERATEISPSYAQGLYCRALMQTMAGLGGSGARNADLAMALSPLDPLLYAMRATRALAHIADGDTAAAARWADAAAHTPRAHAIVMMIAVAAHGLNGNAEAARHWARDVLARDPGASPAKFLESMPVQHAQTRARLLEGLAVGGF
jgi:TolB-like protein